MLKIVNGNCCPPGDLLLNGLGVGLAKEVEQQAGEVVGVRVGIPQLEEVPHSYFKSLELDQEISSSRLWPFVSWGI
jgi:hypothetical protein